MNTNIINANGNDVTILGSITGEDAYVSLTDIAKYKDPVNAYIIIANWLRNRSTIEFLGLWEQIHNSDNFKPIEFDRFKNESGSNGFVLTPKQWIEATNAIGIVSKSGRYGGTYAHSDIAFEFASWISPEFKLYLIEDYKRLKKAERLKFLRAKAYKQLKTLHDNAKLLDKLKANMIESSVNNNVNQLTGSEKGKE